MPFGASVTDTNLPCPTLHPLSLVGKVNGSCVQLGTFGTFVAPSTGDLRLLMNDGLGGFGNNCGFWSVCITPGDFRITAITRKTNAAIAGQTNDIAITWLTLGGFTNVVQFTPGDFRGSYNTNNFVNLSGPFIIPGFGPATTNYTDVFGATNRPARYYRVRMIP